MIIAAKFASVCPCCSGRISVGSSVEWSRGEKARHVACPGASVTDAASTVAPVSSVRTVTVERVGRRSYLRGDTYSVRGMLRAAGCHWDAESKAWWIGDDDAARDLAAKAVTAPAERPSEPARARRSSYGRGVWTGCSCGSRELPDGSISSNACSSCRFDHDDC